MSVALFHVVEMAELASALVAVAKLPKADALDVAAEFARENFNTFWANYRPAAGEQVDPPATREEIEQAMAGGDLFQHNVFGPFRYNLVTNDGRQFGSSELHDMLDRWETKLRAYAESMYRAAKRAAEQKVVDDLFPALPKVSSKELLEVAQQIKKNGQLVIAEYMINESDGNTDYYGGRVARRVAIGICGSKNNFAVMRKAAAAFGPTAHLGPGKDRWTAYIEFTDGSNRLREVLRKPSYEAWTSTTREELEAVVADEIAKETQWGLMAERNSVEYCVESVEHREDYTGGGGYYLGEHRYSGWRVRCEKWGGSSMCEVYDRTLLNSVIDAQQSESQPMAIEQPAAIELATELAVGANHADTDWTCWL